MLPLALLAIFLTASSAFALNAPLTAGDHIVKLQYRGRERRAIVHVPRRAAEKSVLSVVLNFHGGGGHGANQKEYSLLDSLADQETFVAVYPN